MNLFNLQRNLNIGQNKTVKDTNTNEDISLWKIEIFECSILRFKSDLKNL